MFSRPRLSAAAIAIFALLLGLPQLLWSGPAASLPEKGSPRVVIPGASDGKVLRGTPLSSTAVGDTLYFGGTTWDPVDARWEAVPDSVWTFESGVGSAINTDPALKAVGLHSWMEGWYGLDLTVPMPEGFFRRSQECVVNGAWSLWAGVSQAEADSLFYVSGKGYGNDWTEVMGKTFSYPGTGTVTLSYDYLLESEPGYDFLRVQVDTTGNGSALPVTVHTESGSTSGTKHLLLSPGSSLPATSGNFRVLFRVESDGAYSDEDGSFATNCGFVAVDDVELSGAVTDLSDFETGSDGWVPVVPEQPVAGDWSDLRAVSSLPARPPGYICDLGDTVLVFADTTAVGGGHGELQNNLAVSPWIDLAAAGAETRQGRFVEFGGFFDMPFDKFVFLDVGVRWEPSDLPAPQGGGIGAGFSSDGFFYHIILDCLEGAERRRVDLSEIIPPQAERVQIALQCMNFCTSVGLGNCFGPTNSTPWFDDVRFGVYDTDAVSPLEAKAIDLPRDAFPEAGPTMATATARFDPHRAWKPSWHILGDTLVVSSTGTYQDEKVEVVFRVTPGPAIDGVALGNWLSGFTPEAGGWYSARMDTAESAGNQYPYQRRWMTAFHEDDPRFLGADTDIDFSDPDPTGAYHRLANDIFPDDLFTPGTRVDLYFRWSVLTNPSIVSVLPDTAGGHTIEMEVLPSSLELTSPPDPGQTANNKVLLVSAAGEASRARFEEALALLLPGGSANVENVAWDRFDLADLRESELVEWVGNEHDAPYLDAYDVILMEYGTIHNVDDLLRSNDRTGYRLDEWLNCGITGRRGFYFSAESRWSTSDPFQSRLGIARYCLQARNDFCGGVPDDEPEACIGLIGNPGAGHFGGGAALALQDQGLAADWLEPNLFEETEGNSRVNLSYAMPTQGNLAAASMSAQQWRQGQPQSDWCWRSVYDGFRLDALRDGADCSGTETAVLQRLSQVLPWLLDQGTTGVPDPRMKPLVPVVMPFAPNPLGATGGGTLSFYLPKAGHARVEVFDVTGRRVAGLLDERVEQGWTAVAWSGRDDTGRDVSRGIYFLRLRAPDLRKTQKLVITR